MNYNQPMDLSFDQDFPSYNNRLSNLSIDEDSISFFHKPIYFEHPFDNNIINEKKEERNTYKIVEKEFNPKNKIEVEDDEENQKKSTGLSENEENSEEKNNVNEQNNNALIIVHSHIKQKPKTDKNIKNAKKDNNINIDTTSNEGNKKEIININNESTIINILNEEKKEENIIPIPNNQINEREINTHNYQINQINKNENENEMIIPLNNDDINENEIDNTNNMTTVENKKKLLGKKKLKKVNSDYIEKLIRKIILKKLRVFINKKIRIFYKNDIGKGICSKQFVKIDLSELSHSNLEYDKNFVYFRIGHILSWMISKKLTSYLPEHNMKLVRELIDLENTNYFSEVFNLTFHDCLEHFRGTKKNELLNGMETMEILSELYEKRDFELLVQSIIGFEFFLNRRKSRKPREKKKKF